MIGIFGILLIHWLLGGRIRGFEQLKENAADEDGTSVSMEREVALLDLLHALVTICLVAATVLWVIGVKSISPSNWIGFAMLMLLIDYKPFTSVGRFVRAQYPLERLEGRMFQHWRLRVLPPVATVMAVIVAYILFVLPHAALLGRYFPDEVVSQASLLVYTIIVIVCTVTIFKRTSP